MWAQRADRKSGQRDGRKRIPSLAEVNALVEADGPAQLPTPYLEMLFSRARDMMEHERLWYTAATVTSRAEQAHLEKQVAAARIALEPAQALREKAKTELTGADLVARHANEELRSDAFLKLRREAERQARIAAAEVNYQRKMAEVQAVEAKLALVSETVQSRLSIARMRALRISAYLSARTATYWEGLVLHHRDGKHLAPLLPLLSPRLPEWVVPDEPAATDADEENTDPVTTPASTETTATSSADWEPMGGADATAPEEQPVSAYRR
jgi:hypothetical protein